MAKLVELRHPKYVHFLSHHRTTSLPLAIIQLNPLYFQCNVSSGHSTGECSQTLHK
ncbi:hypothetical protein PM082_024054 [Marasmius tenuissimus]|nr:hypothetical protein PM082_024054 [Marasmius tenuissimus]